MTLVLKATAPSGDDRIASIRESLRRSIFFPRLPFPSTPLLPTLRHVSGPFHSYPSPLIYIGSGLSDIQGRPSQWANPYSFLESDPGAARALFDEYLRSRADLPEFLSHLSGAEMICDCSHRDFCHGLSLIDSFQHEVIDAQAACVPSGDLVDPLNADCVMDGFDASDDDDDEGLAETFEFPEDGGVAPPPKFIAEIEAVNETVRSGSARLSDERPGWLPSWVRLIAIVRAATCSLFWEMFSGKAGLTREFLFQGWACGPPVDILYNPDFDLLNPFFLTVVLGLIFERCVKVLHLGPPCSSFSMACNRFKKYAMRSAREPNGFANLPHHRAEKVRLGNALAEVAVRLAEAQEKAGNFWTLEQPASSLMWLFGPVARLIERAGVWIATIDVCMFGAPWRKPTSLAAIFSAIMRLCRRCVGRHSHISLQGKAECGRSWTAIASPYWPAFAGSGYGCVGSSGAITFPRDPILCTSPDSQRSRRICPWARSWTKWIFRFRGKAIASVWRRECRRAFSLQAVLSLSFFRTAWVLMITWKLLFGPFTRWRVLLPFRRGVPAPLVSRAMTLRSWCQGVTRSPNCCCYWPRRVRQIMHSCVPMSTSGFGLLLHCAMSLSCVRCRSCATGLTPTSSVITSSACR